MTSIKLSPEDFVRLWQEAATLNEVCKKGKINKGAARQRAVMYRRKGVPLKMFARCGGNGRLPNDWKGLARLAKSVAVVVE
jgi:hypothetical protein